MFVGDKGANTQRACAYFDYPPYFHRCLDAELCVGLLGGFWPPHLFDSYIVA